MATRYVVKGWQERSEGGKLLADALGATYKYHARLTDDDHQQHIVNWGCGWGSRAVPIMNPGRAVEVCVSKEASFAKFKSAAVPHPALTRDQRIAAKWISQGITAYARYTDSGYRGAGIVVCHNPDELRASSPMYWTQGFPLDREFRVYCCFGTVIGIREKLAPKNPPPDLNYEVRASEDWIYSTRFGSLPDSLGEAALKATQAIGLDFAGVDIGLSEDGEVCVFECNSAPWLSEYLATRMASIIKERFPLE